MSAQHVLIVEDEPEIADLLRDYLVAAGFTADRLDRGDRVVPLIRERPPDLILLDVALPFKDGLEVCREIRTFSKVPIIMVTARVEEIDRILGLEIGADDYICKPFSPREVTARVKAVLRRQARPEETRLKAGDLVLCPETREVTAGGLELTLTPSEFELLKVMISRPQRVFSREELVAAVQGYEFEGYARTIDTHIKNLRKKIAAGLPDREVIQAVYGVGYRLKA